MNMEEHASSPSSLDEASSTQELMAEAVAGSPPMSPQSPKELNTVFSETSDVENEASPEISNNEEEPIDVSGGTQEHTVPGMDADFRTTGRFLCLDTGRRAEGAMELTSVCEDEEEGGISEESVSEAEQGKDEGGGGLDEESCLESSKGSPEVQKGADEQEDHEVSSTNGSLDGDAETTMAKLSHYMQSTEAAAARAADAQERVQKFLASKIRAAYVAPTLTQPKTPGVMKRTKFHKVVKSSEELQLEAALLAQAEWKLKFAKKKMQLAREKQQGKKAKRLISMPKKQPTIPKEPKVLNRPMARKAETSDERALREITEAQQKMAARIESNRRFREQSALGAVETGFVHSARPLTMPKTPQVARRSMKKAASPKESPHHVTQEDIVRFNSKIRKNTSEVLASAMEEAKNRPRITVPKSPAFIAIRNANIARNKPSEKDDKIPNFTARPMPDYNAMGAKGVSNVVKPRSCTVPQSPNITAPRPKTAPSATEEEDKVPNFTARPMPDYNAVGAKGVNNAVKPRSCTVPQSPNITAPRPKTAPSRDNPNITREDMNRFGKNMREETSRELTRAMEEAKSRPRVTVPKPPAMAERASGPRQVPLTKEEQDLAEMAAWQFKARPMNRAVFEGSGAKGVPAVKKAAPTVVEPFAIRGEAGPGGEGAPAARRRASEGGFKARPMPAKVYQQGAKEAAARRASSSKPLTVPQAPSFVAKAQTRKSMAGSQFAGSQDENCPNFTARPMPDYNALGAKGVNNAVKPRSCTVPQSPNISVSNRSKVLSVSQDDSEVHRPFKARPAPSGVRASTGGMGTGGQHRPATVPQPFHLRGESFSQQKKAQLEAQRAREGELEAQRRKSFVAQPAPDWNSTCFIPTHSKKELTEFKEFSITADAQQGLKEVLRAEQLDEEQRLLEAARQFVARPMPGSTFAPTFVPKPSDRPPLVPVERVLVHGEERARERKAFNEAQKARVEDEARRREALVREREAKAEADYQRQMAVPIEQGGLRFVARGVPRTTVDGPDFVPAPSDADLTIPVTPDVLKHPSTRSMMSKGMLGGGAVRVSAS